MRITIHGHNLPGRRWCSSDEMYENVHVGVQEGRNPVGLVPGDVTSAAWNIDRAHQHLAPLAQVAQGVGRGRAGPDVRAVWDLVTVVHPAVEAGWEQDKDDAVDGAG